MPRTKIAEPTLGDDLIWGMDSIAAEIGLPLTRAYYLAATGKLPIRKVGHRTVVASREQLRRYLAGESPKHSDR